MSEQLKLLGIPQPLGTELKEFGMTLVEQKNLNAVELMRLFAYWYAQQHGSVTIEEVRAWAATNGIMVTHPNALGTVFRKRAGDIQFKRIGYRQNSIPSAHARIISVWKAVEKTDGEHI